VSEPVVADTRQCTSCNLVLPVDSFYTRGDTRTGPASHCKACCSKRRRDRYKNRTPEQEAQRQRAIREFRELPYDHPRKVADRERKRAYEESNRAKLTGMRREWRLKNRYGIGAESVQEMFKQQGGCCAICGEDNFGTGASAPNVDHCHATGDVRGILCTRCNHGLGNFKDDTDRLREAIAYLESHLAKMLRVA
jgi:hypothetical protein